MNDILKHLTSIESILKTIRNPNRAYNYLINYRYRYDNPHRRRKKLQNRFTEQDWPSSLSEFLNVSSADLEQYTDEFNSEVIPHVKNCEEKFNKKPFSMGGIEIEAPILYCILRILKPNCVVEVGVANGVSSYYILSALEKNNNGRLISVDIPKYESEHDGEWNKNAGAWIPEGEEVGWIVPTEYKSRWDLQIGDMNDIVPVLMAEKYSMDMLVYDGPKDYITRTRFLEDTYKKSRDYNLLVDDIAWNSSFEEFAAENDLQWKTYGNIGVAINK